MSNTFHLIYKKVLQGRPYEYIVPTLFEHACKERGVTFVGHDVSDNGGSFSLSTLPELGKNDMLYRAATGKVACTAERMMANDTVTSFYTNWQLVNTARLASWFTHRKYNLPVVPSYPGIPASRKELKEVVEQLDSFPIIVKASGGSLGVGVMRVDSMKSLRSILDFFALKKTNVMLRKYIPHEYYVRAVVVGDRVVASKAAYVREGEFRTNTLRSATRKREAKVLPSDLQKQVVQAVRTLGIETGGVDLLFDKTGKAYIAEVNFPNDFSTTQKVTGIDVAGAMVEYLVKKSEAKKSN